MDTLQVNQELLLLLPHVEFESFHLIQLLLQLLALHSPPSSLILKVLDLLFEPSRLPVSIVHQFVLCVIVSTELVNLLSLDIETCLVRS